MGTTKDTPVSYTHLWAMLSDMLMMLWARLPGSVTTHWALAPVPHRASTVPIKMCIRDRFLVHLHDQLLAVGDGELGQVLEQFHKRGGFQVCPVLREPGCLRVVPVSYTHLDPGNLAQSIINMSDNIAHTSKTAVNTADSFAETVKIYEQAKNCLLYTSFPVRNATTKIPG